MAASLWLLVAGGSAEAVPRLVVGIVRGFPGRTVEVPVSLRYRTNDVRDVVALQADVVFDANGVDDGTPSSGQLLSRHVLVIGSLQTLGEDLREVRPTIMAGVPQVFEKIVADVADQEQGIVASALWR